MINNPELIEETINNIKKIKKEELESVIEEMKLEEAKTILKNMDIDVSGVAICSKCVLENRKTCFENGKDCQKEATETVLQALETYQNIIQDKDQEIIELNQKCILEKVAKEEVEELLENSISKDKVKEFLEIEQERFNVYKKESDKNENLKGQMWHHMGAKNMCERLLGIEKLVTLD